ncbi:hypothetical protein M433DRAFT_28263 [Acidomyces richmondensis BFW]|nr:hypothetical protein M433DRAFT_28263 [Acidomyces richmondensis BFW]
MSMPYINIPPPYQPQQFNSHNVTLHVRQQPVQALVALESKERSLTALVGWRGKPVDPPPILQMDVNPSVDPSEQWLVSPYFFVLVVLLEGAEGEEIVNSKELIGQTSSSLHKLKDVNNRDGGFFIFGDLSIRKIGRHRMRFNLFNTDKYARYVDVGVRLRS